ncbi:MAG: hypothetical protein AVDCRST_MAG64-1614, partial [uncultured Phycisphaerae bacterium]
GGGRERRKQRAGCAPATPRETAGRGGPAVHRHVRHRRPARPRRAREGRPLRHRRVRQGAEGAGGRAALRVPRHDHAVGRVPALGQGPHPHVLPRRRPRQRVRRAGPVEDHDEVLHRQAL